LPGSEDPLAVLQNPIRWQLFRPGILSCRNPGRALFKADFQQKTKLGRA
jgi:hypothetical protein